MRSFRPSKSPEKVFVRQIRDHNELEVATLLCLQGLAEFDHEILPTPHNAKRLAELVMRPALSFKDPLLVAEDLSMGVPQVVGALLWPINRDGLDYSVPTATGFATWVSPQHRRRGIATLLRKKAVEILRRKGIKRVIGAVHRDNEAGELSLDGMDVRRVATTTHIYLD